VNHDLSAVGSDAGGIRAEDDRKAVLGHSHAAETPDVVVVQRGRADLDDLPSLSGCRLRDLADFETGDRVVGGDASTDGCEHWKTSGAGYAGALMAPVEGVEPYRVSPARRRIR
jgi:hypothetical protein